LNSDIFSKQATSLQQSIKVTYSVDHEIIIVNRGCWTPARVCALPLLFIIYIRSLQTFLSEGHVR